MPAAANPSANLAAKSSQEGAVGGFGRWLLARQTMIRYGVAPAAVIAALAVRSLFAPLLGRQPPYLFYGSTRESAYRPTVVHHVTSIASKWRTPFGASARPSRV